MQPKWACRSQNGQEYGKAGEALQHPEKPPDYEGIQPNRNDGLSQNRGEHKTLNTISNIKKA